MFGISNEDLLNPNVIKILDGIAGAGKSSLTVNTLRSLGSNFCLASFSNALKFAASDKFGCPTDTICGIAFENSPRPRAAEKQIFDFDTVIFDEILLDGEAILNYMMNHVGEINMIALTDSHQMLSAENAKAALKAYEKLLAKDYTICVEITETKRARDDETRNKYAELYNLESNHIYTIKQAQEILGCDILDFETLQFDEEATYICHTNAIEHEIYKKFDITNRYDIPLIPKNHIARKQNVDVSKFPICDQITATNKGITSYVQAARISSPTRFQGKEIVVGDDCYFVVESDSFITGRELYTVGTRCQSMKSLHMAVIKVQEYKDPDTINGKPVVNARHLDIPGADKTYKCITPGSMAKIIEQYGEKDVCYLDDYVTSGENIIYSTLTNSKLSKFAAFEGNEVKFSHKPVGSKRSLQSVTRRDPTMYFEYLPRVYEILNMDIRSPRIRNIGKHRKEEFSKLCDLRSAFPTLLSRIDMPKAGKLYEEYDPELLNYYIYKGNRVTTGSLITEELANKLGESEYVFSTEKQVGCLLGRYTYEQCQLSQEKKERVNKDFLWGMLDRSYYNTTTVVKNGEIKTYYTKNPKNTLKLVSCALWSTLCKIMLDAVESIGLTEYRIATDGIYYNDNGKGYPVLPEWCDYRIDIKDWTDTEKGAEKYKNIEYQSYETLKTEKELKAERDKARRKTDKYKATQKAYRSTPEYKAKAAEKARLRRAKQKALKEQS